MEMTDNEFAAETERQWQAGYKAAKSGLEAENAKLRAQLLACEDKATDAGNERNIALLQFEEARKIIEQVSYSPEFKKWFYHSKEQDPCGVHAFTAKYAGKAEPAMVCLEGRPLPAAWDGSPKGCWVQHPLTREICQLPPDGHTVHERDDANGTRLLRWGPEKRLDVIAMPCGCDSNGGKCNAHRETPGRNPWAPNPTL